MAGVVDFGGLACSFSRTRGVSSPTEGFFFPTGAFLFPTGSSDVAMVARIVPRPGIGGKIAASPMLVLALDTTSAHGSMALLDGSALRGIVGFRSAQPRHAEDLLPSVDHLLARVDCALDGLQGFAVAIGPGSFTGLRIGVAAVEGLAYALDRPVVGVSTLEATAFRYRHRRGLLVAMIEAYRSEIYGAAYDSNGDSGREPLEAVVEPTCMAPARFLDSLPRTPELVAGSGTVRYRSVIEESLPPTVTIAEPSLFIAEEIARLGARKLAAGERAPLGGLDALYIRSSDAERHLAQAAPQGETQD